MDFVSKSSEIIDKFPRNIFDRCKYFELLNIRQISDKQSETFRQNSDDLFLTVLKPFKFFRFPTEFRRPFRRKCWHFFYKYEIPSFTLHSLFTLFTLFILQIRKKSCLLQIIFVINLIWIQTPTYLRKNKQKALPNSWYFFQQQHTKIYVLKVNLWFVMLICCFMKFIKVQLLTRIFFVCFKNT